MLGSLLLLAGCFRPAGDSIQPTSEAVTNEPSANSAATPTSGEPVITLLSPGIDNSAVTESAPTNEPFPVITAITLAPPTETFTATEIPLEATATLQIITPGISLGLVTPDTATPLPIDTEQVNLYNPATTADAQTVNGEATVSPDCTYTVQPGDNLYRIAIDNNTSLAAMRQANPQLVGSAPILQIGDLLNCRTARLAAASACQPPPPANRR